MQTIIGVRFRPVGKIYYFEPDEQSYEFGDGVIVETARGVEFGRIAVPPKEVEDKNVPQPLKRVIRKADGRDYAQLERNRARRPEAMKAARERVARHNLDMKLVDAEFTFDGAKVIFYFTSDNRVDFRELVKDLAAHFRIRIELRQIGIRDETKMKGGLGPCGRPCCCASHLADFTRVSIKMAKTQGLSLNPGKISGLCGRLMCCLAYENEHYAASAKQIPPVGAEVQTPDGKGRMVSVNLLKMTGRVKLEKEGGLFEFKEYPAADLKGKRAMAEEAARQEEEHDEELRALLDEPEESGERPEPQKPRREQERKRPEEGRRREREGKKPRPERKDDRPREGRQRTEAQGARPAGNRPNEPRREKPAEPKTEKTEFHGGFIGRAEGSGQSEPRREKAAEPKTEFHGGFIGRAEGSGQSEPRREKAAEPKAEKMEFHGGFIGRAEGSGQSEPRREKTAEPKDEKTEFHGGFIGRAEGSGQSEPRREKPAEPKSDRTEFHGGFIGRAEGSRQSEPRREKSEEPKVEKTEFHGGFIGRAGGEPPKAEAQPQTRGGDRWSGLADRMGGGEEAGKEEKVEPTPQNT